MMYSSSALLSSGESLLPTLLGIFMLSHSFLKVLGKQQHALICFISSWLNPLFRIGYKRKLEEDDMYKVLPEDASDRLGEELQW